MTRSVDRFGQKGFAVADMKTASPAPAKTDKRGAHEAKREARHDAKEAARQNRDTFANNELSFNRTPAFADEHVVRAWRRDEANGTGAWGVFKNFGLSNQRSATNSAKATEPLARDIASDAQIQQLMADVKAAGSRAGEIDLRSLSDNAFLSGMARLLGDLDELA